MLTPSALVAAAVDRRIDILALTDHDTTDGVEEALGAARGKPLRLIPGIEISSTTGGRDVHILGIGVDHHSVSFQEKLTHLKKARVERIGAICRELRKVEVQLDPAEIFAGAGGKSVGRMHVARAMVRTGYVKDTDEAFRIFLGQGRPAHVPAHELTPGEAIALIRNAGGVPIVAHPGMIGNDDLLASLVGDGVMGFEVHHKAHDPQRREQLTALALRYGMIMSGGSDFHGDDSHGGGGLGEVSCPPEEWTRIEAHLKV